MRRRTVAVGFWMQSMDCIYVFRRNVFAFRSYVNRRIGAERLHRLINELLLG